MKRMRLRIQQMSVVRIAILLIILGLFFGVLSANMFQSFYYDRMMNYQNVIFTEIVREDIDYSGLFFYVIGKNLKEFIVFWLLSITILGIPYMIMRLFRFGFYTGFFISSIAMQYGFKGIILVLVYGFPHGLIYIPIFLLSLHRGYGLCESIYYENKKLSRSFKDGERLCFLWMFLLVLILIGSFLEAYVGSFF